MAKTTSISEIREEEYTQAIGIMTKGIVIALVAALLFYFMKFFLDASALSGGRIVMGLAVVVGLAITGLGAHKANIAKKTSGATFTCPYCDTDIQFVEEPSTTFVCEHCSRTVQFEEGTMVPVRTVTCQSCKTEHRIDANVQRYVCDNCNRSVNLGTSATRSAASPLLDEGDAMLQNYDVFLIAIDRRKETELAFKIQNLLVVNMVEARRLMSTASAQTPLLVGQNIPQRKAEAIRRSLQDLGATATMRASSGAAPTQRVG